jgi:hypothetical protein
MEPQWVILELLGHRQRAGWLCEEEIAGAGFLRIDLPQEGDPPMRTEWYATAAVYAIHPSDAETVKRLNAPRLPVGRAALPAAEREFDRDGLWDHDPEQEEEPDMVWGPAVPAAAAAEFLREAVEDRGC